jgi:hypothetical protein
MVAVEQAGRHQRQEWEQAAVAEPGDGTGQCNSIFFSHDDLT